MSVQDFAGGNVVDINSGIASSVTAMMIGRRQNFESVAIPLHYMTMTSGARLLPGWLDFCDGCAASDSRLRHAGGA